MAFQKAVAETHKAIFCNNPGKKHNNLQFLEISWFCMPFLEKQLPLSSISSLQFEKVFRDTLNISFTRKQSFIVNVNEFFQDQFKSLLNCQYYNITEFNIIESHKEKFSLFYLNISSLHYRLQDLNDLT